MTDSAQAQDKARYRAFAATLDSVGRGQAAVQAARDGCLWKLEIAMENADLVVRQWGERAMAEAAARGRLDMVRHLHGCNVNINGFHFDDGMPHVVIESAPLHEALNARQWEIVDFMLAHGANPKANNGEILYHALLGQRGKLVRRLVDEEGLRPDRVTPDCARAAARLDDLALLATLLERGLDRQKLFEEAVDRDRCDIVRGLLRGDLLRAPFAPEPSRHLALLDNLRAFRPQAREMLGLLMDFAPVGDADAAARLQEDYRARLAESLAQGGGRALDDMVAEPPAGRSLALALTLSGQFNDWVRPKLAQVEPMLLLQEDANGQSVLRALARYGALQDIFDAALWQGRENRMVALWDAMPRDLQAGVDISRAAAHVRREQLRQQRLRDRARRFKL